MDILERFSFIGLPVFMARLVIMWLTLFGAYEINAQSDDRLDNHHFVMGEELTYSVNYGWLKIGVAEVFMDKEIWYLQGRPHYYIQCRLQTTGVFNFFSPTDVCVESWIDVTSLRPHTSYRQFFYGNSIDIRTDRFDYKDSVTISTYVEDVNRHQIASASLSDTMVLDLLSTYLNLRNIIYQHEESDTTLVRLHFSNDIYPFGIAHSGAVDDMYKFDFIFPESGQYKKGNIAYVLVSKEETMIPEKLVIELTVGKLMFELIQRRLPSD